jgi:hypothetical protein
VALLDVNLNGKQTFPIAELLAGRGVRFIFATGYGEGILPQSLQSGPILQKPFELKALRRPCGAPLRVSAHTGCRPSLRRQPSSQRRID